MSQFIPNFSFHNQPTLKNLLKSHEVNDRLCELQDAFKLSSTDSRNDTLTQDLISLVHRCGRPLQVGPPPTELPPPEVVFEELLQSREQLEPHPNGISSLASAFLNIAYLSLRPPKSSSTWRTRTPCFDLYPLYGELPADADKIRRKEGYGMLSPDCFYDDRFILLPKATAVLLLLFNRNHNYIARRLCLQKQDPIEYFKDDDARRVQQDDDIFQKARAINCAHFRNMMLEDVLKPLIGLAVVGPSCAVDLLSEQEGGSQVPNGKGVEGNSLEASLLYDFSDIMSQKDALQTKDMIQNILEEESEADVDKISIGEFDTAVDSHLRRIDPNRCRRDYAGLPRGANGYFDDLDLAKILHEATECPARRTGGGKPSDQRILQIKTIQWARELKACSFVDYRKSLGLKVPQTFEEWTSDKRISRTAQRLYGRIENLEAYVGLELEDIVPEAKDSGFRFGYTKTFGLLVDIITRIRNDPALTKDITPANVTSWGIQDCTPNRENGSFGTSLPRLLQRTLPRQYSYNNIYGLFPFNTPSNTVKRLESLFGDKSPSLSKYDLEKPKLRKVQHLVNKDDIRRVLNDPVHYPNPYTENLAALTGGYGYLLGFDDPKKHDSDQMMSLHALIPDSGALKRYAESFSMMSNEFIREKTTERGELDVARDVINAVCVRWVCETLLEYPLKIAKKSEENVDSEPGKEQPEIFQRLIRDPIWKWLQKFEVVRKVTLALKEGIHPGQAPELPIEEISDKFASIYAFVFQNFNQEDAWILRETALRTSAVLSAHIRHKIPAPDSIPDQSYSGFLKDTTNNAKAFILNLAQEFTSGTTIQEQSAQTFLSTVVNANKSIPPSEGVADEARIVANVLGLAIVASVKYAKVCTQAVNFYLQEEYESERKNIVELSKKDDIASKRLLMGYIREAYRLDHPLGLWRRTNLKEPNGTAGKQQANGHSMHSVEQNDGIIFADFNQALREPKNVDPNREKVTALQGFGIHKCPGFGFVDEASFTLLLLSYMIVVLINGCIPYLIIQTMPEIFKAIFRLENLRRSKGRRGTLVRFTAHPQLQDASSSLFINPQSPAASGGDESAAFKLGPYPQSLVLEYDVKKGSGNVNGKMAGTKTVSQKRMRWKIIHGKGTEKMRNIMDSVLVLILILLLSTTIFNVIISIVSLFSASPKPAPRPSATAPPPPPPPATTIAGCPLPTSVINPWETITMTVGENGQLSPIEYTLDLPTAHRLSFVDVDEKDMRFRLVFDGSVLGLTPDIVLDKSDSCKDDFAECLNKQFSGGDIVLPQGKHTVRIEWAGVETPGPDGKIDWGVMQGRRIGWSRIQCGA